MIVSIRGTSGSGKTALARKLIAGNILAPIFELNKLVGYQCKSFRVIGPYPNDLRLGVDILNRDRRRRSELFDQIARWSALGNVLYEGLLVSNEVSRTVKLSQTVSTTVIFLTTPLDICLERINLRRTQRASLFGEEFEAVNPKKTTEKFVELQRVHRRLTAHGVNVELLDCDAALTRCRELFI